MKPCAAQRIPSPLLNPRSTVSLSQAILLRTACERVGFGMIEGKKKAESASSSKKGPDDDKSTALVPHCASVFAVLRSAEASLCFVSSGLSVIYLQTLKLVLLQDAYRQHCHAEFASEKVWHVRGLRRRVVLRFQRSFSFLGFERRSGRVAAVGRECARAQVFHDEHQIAALRLRSDIGHCSWPCRAQMHWHLAAVSPW